MLKVPQSDWIDQWEWGLYRVADTPSGGPSGKLSADWYGLLELERRLIEPYVRFAAAREVHLARAEIVAPPQDSSPTIAGWGQPIGVREQRRWTSILMPIYLQLAEALRRVSEGKSGATFCRECGEPFLTLDARRSTFCNDRERFRFSQRNRRRRLLAADVTNIPRQ